MQREIDNACVECHNDICEYLNDFDKNFLKMQKELHCLRREQHNVVYEIDYGDLYRLRNEICSKIRTLNNKLRKILKEQFNLILKKYRE